MTRGDGAASSDRLTRRILSLRPLIFILLRCLADNVYCEGLSPCVVHTHAQCYPLARTKSVSKKPILFNFMIKSRQPGDSHDLPARGGCEHIQTRGRQGPLPTDKTRKGSACRITSSARSETASHTLFLARNIMYDDAGGRCQDQTTPPACRAVSAPPKITHLRCRHENYQNHTRTTHLLRDVLFAREAAAAVDSARLLPVGVHRHHRHERRHLFNWLDDIISGMWINQ